MSSTLMPGGSELLFAGLLAGEEHDPWLLLGVATTGNTLGGMTSWAIGRGIVWRYPGRRIEERHGRAVERVRRFGAWALLLSWLPVIGDPLCVAAGWLKVHWLKAALLIGVGKALRYGAILWALH